MRERWLRFCGEMQDEGACRAIFEVLDALYAHPRRIYHNLDHIADCLRQFDTARSLARDPWVVELAIWTHDCIYEPGRSDNEKLSARIAKMIGHELGMPATSIDRIGDLVMATHHPTGSDAAMPTGDEALVADVDLAILAAGPEDYDRYAAAIHVEFGFVPDTEYRAGRAKFLRGMLARPSLFATAEFRERYEETARANLEREIAVLESEA